MAFTTECAVCGKEIEMEQEDYNTNTEPLCNEHREEEEINHG